MARRRTLPQNIRKYKQEYLRLLAYEARLNHQLFKMKKRIKLLVEEEQLRLTEKALLTEQLQGLHQQKAELESQPACKQRNTQLKRVEKEYKQVQAKHSRNRYQLDQLEVRKDKDNAVKLLLKEAKRDDVTVRIQSAYETWMQLEQIQQQELAEQLGRADRPVVGQTCRDAAVFSRKPSREVADPPIGYAAVDARRSLREDKIVSFKKAKPSHIRMATNKTSCTGPTHHVRVVVAAAEPHARGKRSLPVCDNLLPMTAYRVCCSKE